MPPSNAPLDPAIRFYLLFSAVGLLPIALSYGISPGRVIPAILDVPVETTDLAHVLRAVMGLYVALIGLWIAGSIRSSLTTAALVADVIFMFGLAAGRLLSLVLDGMPSPLLTIYLVLEVGMGLWGVAMLRRWGAATR
ncbi:MAG: hypothetical protein RLZZ565_511 [Planctomycetota bacterium]|jgi:hypothetical protein